MPGHHEARRFLTFEVRGEELWARHALPGNEAPPGLYRAWRLAGVPAAWLHRHGYAPEPLRIRGDEPIDHGTRPDRARTDPHPPERS